MLTSKAFALAAVLGAAFVSAADTALCGAHGISLKADNGLSPCEIASLMVGKGTMPADSPFPDLEAQGMNKYPIPTLAEVDDLRCNMIFYNLVSGCSACQLTANTWAPWDDWTSHCKSQSSVGPSLSYIASIMPYNTPIPNWAFTDALVTGGTFNATAAETVAENLYDVPDTVFNVKTDGSVTPSSTSTASPATGASCAGNAGAIAGGTLGGFAGGAVLGAAIAFLVALKKGKKVAAVGDDGQHSVRSQDTLVREKARIAGLA
ncbi:hypothetical protein C8Q80DRAFT_1116348 [Daedaleopsis nitida]|nr:hypothetical protein C8Q80DRAFT_1116348 [Daedaleopsis nitida]